MHRTKKNRGSALLTALFIMTLVAIVATAMTTRLQLDIYRTRLVIMHDKLYLASQAVIFWSLSELNNNKKQFTKTNKQGLVAQFPKNMEQLDSQVILSGGLYDLQARFNLNNVINNKSMPAFINLVHQLVPGSNETEITSLALAVKDWLTPYELAHGKDSYTSYYLSQKPPYFPSHQIMQSASEFRLVKDVSASTYIRLEPFITALPESTLVNINTAPKQVLMSLGNGISEDHANELIKARGESGFKDLKEVGELLKKLDVPNDQITIESQYFLSVASAKNSDFNLVVYALIKRSRDKQGKLTVSIIRESSNSF